MKLELDEARSRLLGADHGVLATSSAGGPRWQVRHQLPPVDPVLHIPDATPTFPEAHHREIAWDEHTRHRDEPSGRDLGRRRRGSVELAHRREEAGLT